MIHGEGWIQQIIKYLSLPLAMRNGKKGNDKTSIIDFCLLGLYSLLVAPKRFNIMRCWNPEFSKLFDQRQHKHTINVEQCLINTINMKLLLKYDDQPHIYEGKTTFKDICENIRKHKSQYSSEIQPKGYSLSRYPIRLLYKDQDDDLILITSQNDLRVVLKMNQQKELLVLTEDPIKQIQSNNLSIKKPYQEPFLPEKQSTEKYKNESNKKSKASCIKEQIISKITQKLTTLISVEIANAIPCIVNQVYRQISSLENIKGEGQKMGVIHKNIKCNGCQIEHIEGIQYQCSVCFDFNLCEKCENSANHPHNFIKIKIPETSTKKSVKTLDTSTTKIPNQNNTPQSKPLKDITTNKTYKNHISSMIKHFGGQQNNYHEFVKQNLHLNQRMLISRYKFKHNIQATDYEIQNKVRKLQIYFEKTSIPENISFRETVNANHHLEVADIIQIIHDRDPSLQFDPGNLDRMFQMKRKFKIERNNVQNWIIQLSNNFYQGQRHKPSEFEISRAQQCQQIREKGRILTQMQEIFGKSRPSHLFKFIQTNFQLGIQKIIQNWLQQEFDMNKDK